LSYLTGKIDTFAQIDRQVADNFIMPANASILSNTTSSNNNPNNNNSTKKPNTTGEITTSSSSSQKITGKRKLSHLSAEVENSSSVGVGGNSTDAQEQRILIENDRGILAKKRADFFPLFRTPNYNVLTTVR
jgi:hypothetical protein